MTVLMFEIRIGTNWPSDGHTTGDQRLLSPRDAVNHWSRGIQHVLAGRNLNEEVCHREICIRGC